MFKVMDSPIISSKHYSLCMCIEIAHCTPQICTDKMEQNKNNGKNLSRSVKTSSMIDVSVYVPGLGILLSFFFVSFYHKMEVWY